jgi:hypothetical protein
MLAKTTALVAVVLGASLSIARADADPNGAGAAPMSSTAGDNGPDQLVLPKGRLVLDAFLEINLSDGHAGKPFSISPDLWYGVNDDLTVGLVHSYEATFGFIGGGGFMLPADRAGSSLCLTGDTTGGCNGVYNNLGLEGRYQIKMKNPDIALAAIGGLYVNSFKDPFSLDVKVGALARWHKDKLAVEVEPSVFIALTKRSVDLAGAGTATLNHDILNLPITGLYTVMPKLAIAAQVGVILPFEDAGIGYQIPLSLGAHYSVNDSITVNGAISLTALAGGSGIQTGADGRAITLGGSYAF